MTTSKEETYFQRRALEEREKAQRAADPGSRYAHRQMAGLYRAQSVPNDGQDKIMVDDEHGGPSSS